MFDFEIGEKLDQYFDVKFDEESEFYRFEAEKYNFKLEITGNLKTTCLFWLEARFTVCN